MNPGPLLFLGAFFALATSWLGFVLTPQLQIGRQQPVELKDTGQLYPAMRPGMARQGEAVYRANGCFYCHSQQVRPQDFGGDKALGWDGRPSPVQSVAQDYLFDRPVMLGSQRVGPDLANIGLRQPDAASLLKHLYDPRSVTPKSVMPPYRFLFVRRKLAVGEKPYMDALSLAAGIEPGYQVIPTDDARSLVAYLQSLHSEAIIFETPPFPTTNVVAGASTNAPAGTNAPTGTNAPAGTNAAAATTTNSPAK